MSKLFAEGSPSRQIMEIALFCGCVPYRCFSLFYEDPRYYYRSAKLLVKHGYMESVKIDMDNRVRLNVLLPTKQARTFAMTQDYFFDDIDFYMKNGLNAMRPTSDDMTKNYVVRRKVELARAVAIAESAAFFSGLKMHIRDLNADYFMGGQNMELFPTEKKPGVEIRLDENGEIIGYWPEEREIPEGRTFFYLSSELKAALDPDQSRSCSGRVHGMLVNGDYVYSILNMPGKTRMLVRSKTERSTRITLMNLLQSHYKGHKRLINNSTIILSNHIELMGNLLENKMGRSIAEGQQSYFSIDDGSIDVRESLYIPLSKEGQKILSMLLTQNAVYGYSGRQVLLLAFAKNPLKPSGNFVCDYIEGENNAYVLNFLIPDLYRLKQFINAASYNREDFFIVHCYRFAEDTIYRYIRKRKINNLQVIEHDTDEVLKRYVNRVKQEEGEE